MNVIFVEPLFPRNQREFPRALCSVGASVYGVGERSYDQLDDELRRWLRGYWQIGSVVDVDALEWATRQIQGQIWVDRLEATIESHVLPAAVVRERCGIPGTSVRTTTLCRDKAAMKDVLREAGVPCAASARVSSAAEVREFVGRHGYPVILKPVDSAGASGTYRVDREAELDGVLGQCGLHGERRSAALVIEEFNEGHEGFYDTLTVRGRVAHDFACHYYPNVLEAMRTRWISPQIVCTNRVDGPGYEEIRALGRRVIEVLGIETSATHMEWFFGPKGLRFSEIGCRPPGVGVWDLYCAANEVDVYAEWAKLVVHGGTDVRMSRRYSAGTIALRPECDGHIRGYRGLEDIQRRYGAWLLRAHLPAVGEPTQSVANGYHANAWLSFRHPDYDGLRELLDDVGRTVQVLAH
ncbi:MAG: ATPase [Planctomycetes bacterium]|nr:ATPase [Planctomycetota bacterium]